MPSVHAANRSDAPRQRRTSSIGSAKRYSDPSRFSLSFLISKFTNTILRSKTYTRMLTQLLNESPLRTVSALQLDLGICHAAIRCHPRGMGNASRGEDESWGCGAGLIHDWLVRLNPHSHRLASMRQQRKDIDEGL